jgi:hypothetical protein
LRRSQCSGGIRIDMKFRAINGLWGSISLMNEISKTEKQPR